MSPPLFLFGFILMVVLKQTLEVKNRGYGFLIPIGKILTQHEEKNDVRFFFFSSRFVRRAIVLAALAF